jgi:hypothetical protein
MVINKNDNVLIVTVPPPRAYVRASTQAKKKKKALAPRQLENVCITHERICILVGIAHSMTSFLTPPPT